MKSTRIALAGVLVLALTASAVASAQGGAPTARSAKRAKLELRRTGLGKILATGSGFSLYMFTKDSRGKSACVKVSGCSAVWPALTSTGKPTLGPGVRASLVSTIRLPGGASQVTYAGHPLYTYSGDFGPGQTSYVGASQFGGKWYALNASGRAVR